MLIFYLNWAESEHDPDDFILILEALSATPAKLKWHKKDYRPLTDCLRIQRQEVKNITETVVSVFGMETNKNLFIAKSRQKSFTKPKNATGTAPTKESLPLHEAQSRTGFLSFCARVVRLGRLFMRRLWDFVASYPSGSSWFTK